MRQDPPLLFHAVYAPPMTLGMRGLLLVAGFFALGSLMTGVLFLVLGAWPVLGFCGVEVAFVIGLLVLYRRRARRSREAVELREGRLTVLRHDDRGRAEELALDPYWARLRLEERLGRVSGLFLVQRGRTVEIAAMLGEDEKRDLAGALGEALRRYREPVFDNPQLR
jgi:uncharacterized membrane protein